MTYKHLSQNERYQIYALLEAGHNQMQIAHILGRHRSTISREVSRNSGFVGYRPRLAQELSIRRSERSRNAPRVPEATLRIAAYFLRQDWSPEQVAGFVPVSHETLYRYIYTDKAQGGSLWRGLRCQKKKRKRYAGGRERRGQLPNRRSIHDRPASVETRSCVGHWEGDTVIGAAHKHAIVTVVERKSGFAVLAKVENKTSEAVSQAIINRLKPYVARVTTLTYDNGREFADHARIDDELNSTAYFADPFASWQRGSNENFNGLLRQYIPKKRPLSTVTDEELKMIEDKLNFRPRKRLGFKTPHQVFHESLNRVALRD
jgi:transposase, IS30 family